MNLFNVEDWNQFGDAFDFNDQLIFHQKIQTISAIELESFVP